MIPELSTERVLTTEWVDGDDWATFVASAGDHARQRAGEIIWRFAQASILRMGAFNGDPHPGNYRFHEDGTVTFLDFGLVKRWSPGEWERLAPSLDAIFERDPDRLVERHGSGGVPATWPRSRRRRRVYDYVSAPYVPYLVDEFTFTRHFVADALSTIIDLKGPHAAIIEKLNMPPSFVILDRVVWGVERAVGQARRDPAVAGDAPRVPGRRTAGDRAGCRRCPLVDGARTGDRPGGLIAPRRRESPS